MNNKYIPIDANKVYTTYIHQVKGLKESLEVGKDHTIIHTVNTLQEMLNISDLSAGDICVVENEQKTYISKSENNGHIDNWQLLSSPSTTTYVVDKDAEMLVISLVNKGDICIRPDLESTFINITGNNGTMNDWQEFSFPATNHKHIYKTIVEMLNTSNGEIKEGDICLVYEDPDRTKNGDYHVLVDNPSSLSQVLYVGVDNRDIIFTVDNLADMVQLPAHQGDICYRGDIQVSYKSKGGVNRTLDDWQEMGSKVVISEVATEIDRDNIQNIKTGDICIISDINSTFIVDKNDVWKKVLSTEISKNTNNYITLGNGKADSDNLPYVNTLAIEEHIGGNLFYNGFGMLEDNTNWKNFEFTKTHHLLGAGSFYKKSRSVMCWSDRKITTNIKDDYKFSCWIKTPTGTNGRRLYSVVEQFDIDGLHIGNNMGNPVSMSAASETTLAREWTPGTKVMYLNDVSGWTDKDTKTLLLYPYHNSEGNRYADYEYSRHVSKYPVDRPTGTWRPYKNYVIDYTANTITFEYDPTESSLVNPRTVDGHWPKNTPIKQSWTSSTYYYPWSILVAELNKWQYVKGYFDYTRQWYGLNTLRLGFLTNYISNYNIGKDATIPEGDIVISGASFIETDELKTMRSMHGIYDIKSEEKTIDLSINDEAFQYDIVRFSGLISHVNILDDLEEFNLKFINITNNDIIIKQYYIDDTGVRSFNKYTIAHSDITSQNTEIIHTQKITPNLIVGIV